jgi:hypothetical protein
MEEFGTATTLREPTEFISSVPEGLLDISLIICDKGGAAYLANKRLLSLYSWIRIPTL